MGQRMGEGGGKKWVCGGVFGAPDPTFYTGHIPSSLRAAATQPVISNAINIMIIAIPCHTNLCLQSHSIVIRNENYGKTAES